MPHFNEKQGYCRFQPGLLCNLDGFPEEGYPLVSSAILPFKAADGDSSGYPISENCLCIPNTRDTVASFKIVRRNIPTEIRGESP